jgi:hypothetical protein
MMMSLKKKNVEKASNATTFHNSIENTEDENLYIDSLDIEDTVTLDHLQDSKPINKYRLKNQRWTRWDVVASQYLTFPESTGYRDDLNSSGKNGTTIELSQSNGESLEKNGINDITRLNDNEKEEDDDALQSDDDVVGPWHEATPPVEEHAVDPSSFSDIQESQTSEETAVQNWKAIQELNPDAQLATVIKAPNVPTLTVTPGVSSAALTASTNDHGSGGIAPNSKAITAKRKVKVMDAVAARKATTKAKAKPQHPPTKSSYAIKTDKKMKQQTASKGKKGKKKGKKQAKKSSRPQEEFSTTGAFLTRGTARQLAGPYGFQPNPFNYHHKQDVEVLNINGCWYSGVLMEMSSGRVKVKYTDWKEHEWIIIGSRRLRPVAESTTADEIANATANESSDPSLKAVGTENDEDKTVSNAEQLVSEPIDLSNVDNLLPQGINGEVGSVVEMHIPKQDISDAAELSMQTSDSPVPALPIKKRMIAESVIHEYRTTGAFATRNTLRELADPHGFTPNAYG